MDTASIFLVSSRPDRQHQIEKTLRLLSFQQSRQYKTLCLLALFSRWYWYTTALSHLSRISALAQTRNLEPVVDSASYVRRITLDVFSQDEPTFGLSTSRYPRKVWIHKQWARQVIDRSVTQHAQAPQCLSLGWLGRSQRNSRL